MEHTLFDRYAAFLHDTDVASLDHEIKAPRQLVIETGMAGTRRLDIAYAPFDHLEARARIVIVGLTPGRQQMRNALFEARRLLRAGATHREAMAGAKVHASFSGPMRANLVAMLDSIGVNRLLRIGSTAALWEEASHLVNFTSALRYPVFVDGENFSGNPDMLRSDLLRAHLERWFGGEVDRLRDAVFIPLGPRVDEAVKFVCARRGIDERQVLSGLPHPSGANAERIAFFLDRKARADLSSKVAPDRILASRNALLAKIKLLEA